MKNRLKRLTGIIGALLIAVSPCGSQTMAYASEPAETEAAFYDDGADFEIQEDTDEQVQDQEDLDLTEEEEDPDTADIQIEEDTEDADSEDSELTSEETLFSDSPVEEELFLVWEEMMAQAGEVVFRKREAFIREFIPIFQSFYSFISQDREKVGLSYDSYARDASLLEVLKESRARD